MFFFAIVFSKYLKHINAKSPFSCTDLKNCARKRAFIGYVLPFCISVYTLYGIRTSRIVSLLLFFRLLTRLFTGILSYVQVRIRNTGMVNSLESFDEYLLSESNVSERDRALLEETICHLSVDELIDEVTDAFFCIFVQRARSRFNRICHHQNGLFAGKWVRTRILEL